MKLLKLTLWVILWLICITPSLTEWFFSEYRQEIYSDDTVIQESVRLITSFEGYHSKPYWDYKQYSIWYWQKAHWLKYISKKDALKFVETRANQIRDRYNLKRYPDEIEVALISFTYNIGRPPLWYKWFIDNWYYNALWNRMKAYKYCGWKVCGWLVKRRYAEVDYFINITK